MGKLIVIEGVDGSGKETQTELLCKYIAESGKTVERLSFPDYASQSSALVKMYLRGEFGSEPSSVNPYAASLFYAVDRFASCAKGWGERLKGDRVIVADRYVTSNIVYQTAKLVGDAERRAFIRWEEDLEYGKLGLPRPDAVIFLNMEPEASALLREGRKNKITGGDEKDVHERDEAFLRAVYESAAYAAELCGWDEVKCSEGGVPRSIEAIHNDIKEKLRVF